MMTLVLKIDSISITATPKHRSGKTAYSGIVHLVTAGQPDGLKFDMPFGPVLSLDDGLVLALKATKLFAERLGQAAQQLLSECESSPETPR